MLNRICPECANKSLKVSLLGGEFVCHECVSRFKLKSWVVWLECFIGSLLGTAFFYLGLFFLNLYLFIVLVVVSIIVVTTSVAYFGSLKLVGLKGLRRGSNS
jgi:hypothetical protein